MATTQTRSRPQKAATSKATKAPAARKTTAAKKPVAKAAPEKSVSRKSVAEKPVIKKAVAKTAPARKVPAKKAAAQAAPKKAAPSKPAPKKVARRKTAGSAAAGPHAGARHTRSKPSRTPDVAERLHALVVAALDDLKAKDILKIDVRGKSSVTDLMVLASGTSSRHVKSIADEVVKKAKQAGLPPIGVEGQREGEWVLVDLGDIIVHVMLPRTREFYGLERLWTVGDGDDEMQSALAG